MQSLKILALTTFTAVTYGILHDQVTARLCIEYFTIFHRRAFAGDSPTLHALYWGVVATWWMGLGLGIPICLFARYGRRPKLTARDLVRPLVWLMVASGLLSSIFGTVGYFYAQAGDSPLSEPWFSLVPRARHAFFLADLWAHRAAYATGLVGSVFIWGWCVYRRNVLASTQRLQQIK